VTVYCPPLWRQPRAVSSPRWSSRLRLPPPLAPPLSNEYLRSAKRGRGMRRKDAETRSWRMRREDVETRCGRGDETEGYGGRVRRATSSTARSSTARNEQCGAQRAVQHARSGGATWRTTGARESHEQLCGETNVASFFAREPNPLGDGFSVDVTDDANGVRRIRAIHRGAQTSRVFPQPKKPRAARLGVRREHARVMSNYAARNE
jgi:hypothetical protein